MRAGQGLQGIAFTGQSVKDYEYGGERYLEEARLVARFNNHPHILAVLNFFRENGTAYIVMEYLEGRTLDQYLEQMGGRLSFDEAVPLLTPIMHALEEVHEAGILHRDVSPDNIHIGASRQVKLLDFGAARVALGERSRNLSVILKEGYAPPEQYRSKGNQGPWTDVYALAATLYRTVTGFLPPPALDRMTDDELKPLSHLGVPVSEQLDAVMSKALAFNAQDRYQTVRDFREAITQPNAGPARPGHAAPAVTVAASSRTRQPISASVPEPALPAFGSPSGPPLPEMPPPAKMPWIWIAVGAAVVLGGVFGGINYLRPKPQAAAPAAVARQQSPLVESPQAPAASYTELIRLASAAPSPDKAADLLRQAIQADPQRPEPHDLLGQILLYKLNKPVEAEEQYRYALKLGGKATFLVNLLDPKAGSPPLAQGQLRIDSARVVFADNKAIHMLAKSRKDVQAPRSQKDSGPSLRLGIRGDEPVTFAGTSANRSLEMDIVRRLLAE
ncbi:MAG: protein kinase [Bryobacterales bacterium]|nr:protein kinase [Bryobacterales bacterium]